MTNSYDKRVLRSNRHLAAKLVQSFVEQSLPMFPKWIQQVAEGIPQYDGAGNRATNADGSPIYVVKPDPATAIKVVSGLVDFATPRLSRSEISASVEHLPIDQQSSLALQQRVLESLGLTTYEPEDVEPIERSDG